MSNRATLPVAIQFETASPAPGVSPSGEARIYFDGTNLKVSQNGGAYVNLITTSTLQSVYTAGGAGGGAVTLTSSGGPLALTNPNGAAQPGIRVTQNNAGSLAAQFTGGSVSCIGSAANSERFGAAATADIGSSVFGANASATGGGFNAVFGEGATATAGSSVAVGANATATGANSVVVGQAANDGGFTSIVLGRGAFSTADGQFIGGGGFGQSMNNVYFGSGVSAATPADYTIHGSASGTNGTPGASVGIAAGAAHQAADLSGSVFLKSGTAADGTAITGWVQLDPKGNFVLQASGAENTPAGTSNAWPFLATVNGTPTAAPTSSYTGAAAFAIDRSTATVLAYYGGAWNTVGTGTTTTLQGAYTAGGAGGGAIALTASGGPIAITNPNGTSQAGLTVTQNNAGSLAALFSGSSISCPGLGGNSERFGLNASASGPNGLAVGNGAQATANGAVALGRAAVASTNDAVALGAAAQAAGAQAVSINAVANGSAAIAINGNASFANSIALLAATTASNQFVAGSETAPISDVFFGVGAQAVASPPQNYTIHGVGGRSGQSDVGGTLFLAGGFGSTGAQASGKVTIQTATGGFTLVDRFRVSADGAEEFVGLPTVSQPAVSAAGEARVYFDTTTNELMQSLSGAAYVPIGSGSGSITITSYATSTTLSATPTQQWSNNTGAVDAPVVLTLPVPTGPGLVFTFYNTDPTNGIEILADPTSEIFFGKFGTTGLGGFVKSVFQGSSTRLVSQSATMWVAEEITGNWTVNA
jgi:hypothetical protein